MAGDPADRVATLLAGAERRVEYVHGTYRREFYECAEMAADLAG